MMVDAPHLDDSRVYCIDCYAELFPPGWTDEYQPLADSLSDLKDGIDDLLDYLDGGDSE